MVDYPPPAPKLLASKRSAAPWCILPTEWQNHSWRWDCQGHISPNWRGVPRGEASKCMCQGKRQCFMNFLATHIFQESLRRPSPLLRQPSSIASFPSSNSYRGWGVLCDVCCTVNPWSEGSESTSEPVVKTNFVYHRVVPCIIITPAQQLGPWIPNNKRWAGQGFSKADIHMFNMSGQKNNTPENQR